VAASGESAKGCASAVSSPCFPASSAALEPPSAGDAVICGAFTGGPLPPSAHASPANTPTRARTTEAPVFIPSARSLPVDFTRRVYRFGPPRPRGTRGEPQKRSARAEEPADVLLFPGDGAVEVSEEALALAKLRRMQHAPPGPAARRDHVMEHFVVHDE